MSPNALSDPDPGSDRPGQRSPAPPPPPDSRQQDPRATTEAPTPGDIQVAITAEFTAFYRTSAPRLVAFLRWHGAPLPDAADCAQEALTLCFRQWSSIEHPHAWCRLVASRLYARRVATVREHLVEDLDTAAGSPLLSPDTDLDALEHRHTVLALLDLLPPRQRQIMAWTYDGATPSEIAAALQISPDAVRANLHKARITLRTHRDEIGGHR